MDFYCAILESKGSVGTLAFAERKEFFEKQSLASKVIVYQIQDFDELEKLAQSIRKKTADTSKSHSMPTDGIFTIRSFPEKGLRDLEYDYCILKYWFPKEDKIRVLSGFKIEDF